MPIGFGLKAQPTYKYSPLDEVNVIRLLRLDDEPDTLEGDIHGTLIHTAIDRAPPYFALSYCWGRLEQKDALICDGMPFRITPSLAEALRRLRSLASDQDEHPEWDLGSRYFWIDQICINQADTEERQSQVQMMGQIYSQAIRTLIWLGPDLNGLATEGLHLARIILEMVHKESRMPGGSKNPLGSNRFDQRAANILQQLSLEYGGTNFKGRPWSSFIALSSRSWSRRLWVIQEAVLSAIEPVVLCGRSICGWNQFACAASFMRSDPAKHAFNFGIWINRCLDSIIRINLIRMSGRRRLSLETLIGLTHDAFFVSNPRDKIFGLLGLSCEGSHIELLPEALRPDYRSDTYKIYARVTRYFIMENPRSLAPICCDLYAHPLPWTRNYSWPSLGKKIVPSWTPNWNHTIGIPSWTFVRMVKVQDEQQADRTSYVDSGFHFNLEFHSQFNAAANIPAQEFSDEYKGRMKLRGIVVDTVATCLATGTSFRQQQFTESRIRHVGDLCQGFKREVQRLHNTVDSIDRRVQLAHGILSVFRRPLTLRILEMATERRPDIEPLSMIQMLTRILISCLPILQYEMEFDLENYYLRHMRMFCTFLVGLLAEERRRTSKPQYFRKYDEILRAFANENSESEWEQILEVNCPGKRFFITSKGYLGQGPPGMKKSDVVCVLFGSGVPFILRRKQSSKRVMSLQDFAEGGLFALIGPSYVDGIMQGEAVEAAREGALHERDFEIV